MLKKDTTTKKSPVKIKKLSDADKKLIQQRGKEFLEWKEKNITQQRFFSLEEKEQKLLETSYVAIMQLCPDLTWEDYLNRLRITDTCNKTTKTIKNGALKIFHIS